MPRFDRFDIADIKFYRHALHNHAKSNDHPERIFPPDEHAFQSGHRSGGDADLFSENQICVGFNLSQGDAATQRVDLDVG
jgi:hypothetical protein